MLKQMNGAIRGQEMYPHGHPATFQATEKLFLALQEIFESTDQLTITRVEGKIVINGKNLEREDFPNRWLEKFDNQNLSSLTISKSLTKDELNRFLSCFAKPTGESAPTTNLLDYIKRNDIQSIKVDQLRYELVNHDEVVVKSEVVEGADLKAQISKIMKENPELLRDVVLHKSVVKERYANLFSAETDPTEVTQQIGEQVKSLSDDEVLSFLTSSLNRNLKKSESQDRASALNEVVELAKTLLQERRKTKLLPQVKRILAESGMIEKEQLDFLFEDKWFRSQEVLDELVRTVETLGTEQADFENFMFFWQRVISSEDSQIRRYAIDKVLSRLDSENYKVRRQVVSALEAALDRFVKEKMEPEFSHIREKLYAKVKDHSMPGGVLSDYGQPVKMIFSEMIQRGDLTEARKILHEYTARLHPDKAYPEDVRKIAQEFIRQVSDEATLVVLTSRLKEGVPFETLKLAEWILGALDGEKVAQRLLDIFTSDDRAARVSALRVLSRLGRGSISAFRSLLSNPRMFTRKEGSTFLLDEKWHKLRNIIYVLGNIPNDQSVEILSGLSKDSDKRIRLEVIKSLEKIGSGQSVDALVSLLDDGEDEVRRGAIGSMTALADRRCLEPLKRHFRHNHKDWKLTIDAVSKVGGEASTEFFLHVLRKDEGIEDLASREKDEIKMAVLNILGKMRSPQLADEIKKFVEQRGKGLMKLVVKDKVTEAANRAIGLIQSKTRMHSQDARD